MSRQVGLQELINSFFDDRMNIVHTAIPCIVIAVREELREQVVDIQPTINQKFQDGTVKERPPILGVPVSFPVSKTAGFTFPVNVGDTGFAIFSMRNLDAWKSGTGYPATPLNAAKYDKGDAIFLPGIQPPSVAVNNPNKRLWPHDTKDAVLVNNIGQATEVEIRAKANGDVQVNTHKNVEINCDNAQVIANTSVSVYTPSLTMNADNTVWNGNITLNGNLLQTGNYTSIGTMTFNGINFAQHKHTNVQPGTGTSGGPVA